jgi:O-acetyl-ADP-ribose deacetylase (regulator of RNase III)
VSIQYVTGDATNPTAKGPKIIAHIVNDAGAWGKGFVLAVSGKWPHVRESYLRWAVLKGVREPREGYPPFELGEVQLVPAVPYVTVANMLAQHGLRGGSKGPPIRYEALEHALVKVAFAAKRSEATVHMPRIGTGLAGGSWVRVESILKRVVGAYGIEITVYDLGEGS